MGLLLMEGDEMIAETVLYSLRRSGYLVDWAKDDRVAELFLSACAYDLLLLGVDLRTHIGIEALIARHVKNTRVPVMHLTACDPLDDCTSEIDQGTHRYVMTSFDLDKLTARVRTVVRTTPSGDSDLRRFERDQRPAYVHGELTLDPATHQARKGAALLNLLTSEFSLLEILIAEPTRVFRRAELQELLFGPAEQIDDAKIEAEVDKLRRKIGTDQLVTVRGVGYRLKAPT